MRPKDRVKEMFVRAQHGARGPPVESGYTIKRDKTLPDVNSDELFAMLDRDTGLLKMLICGLGRGMRARARP